MSAAAGSPVLRIQAMVTRYVIVHMRSVARLLELFFWPVMELLVWGFLTLYLQKEVATGAEKLLLWLLTGMIFWDVLFRAQQAVSLALMEELWSRNVLNLFISPLRTWEWVAAACVYGLIKTTVIVAMLFGLATLLYAYQATALGFALVPFMFNLLLLGWAMGLFAAALLLRWGHAAESLIWGIPFFIQPFSAIFYPLSIYPSWLKPICLLLPSTHVMEGMRSMVSGGGFSWGSALLAFGMNAVYLGLCSWFYVRMLERGRDNGQLVRITA